ncbi:CoA transferase [Frankia sp. Cr1]|uniref:CaiB/BaiF CoA transferase family protein n=1 Tax=Frankia sp. Cr1 TaxID=3073931 RepID=UPI002AD35623|nr:CoA transferase [Frankia sp. Cr1]
MGTVSRLLEGVRVLESAMLFNGDTLGTLLADLGADVIKVESPGTGDYLRGFLGQITPQHSPAHIQVNKNKRSITLDLRRDEGRALFYELLSTADVFVDGFAGDACTKLGIGYAQQRAAKPDIVYCQYSGYGSEGPLASMPTHGQMTNALAGALPVEMGPDGLVRRVQTPDYLGGTTSGGEGTAAGAVHAAFHVAAALFQRERTGEGCFLDAAASDAVIAQAWIAVTYNLNRDRVTDHATMPRTEEGDSGSAFYQFYEARDGRFLLFCATEPKFWRGFCLAVDRADLIDRLDTGGPVDFGFGLLGLRRELQKIFHTRDADEWVALALTHHVPLTRANRLRDLLDDPHVRARGILVEGEHPLAGPFTYVGEAVRVQGQPWELRRPAPTLGQHTDELLAEIGHGPQDVAALRAAKIV